MGRHQRSLGIAACKLKQSTTRNAISVSNTLRSPCSAGFDGPQKSHRRIEAHLFDAAGDWYGRWLRVEVVQRLRDVRKFLDAAALMAQLREDEQNARAVLARDVSGVRKHVISVDPALGRT